MNDSPGIKNSSHWFACFVWGVLIALHTSPVFAVVVSPTGILPNGTFINDYSGDIGEFGVAEFEILWFENQSLTLTIQFDENDFQSPNENIALRISNVNNTSNPWSEMYVRIDDAIQDGSSDDPLWDSTPLVDVIPFASSDAYQVLAIVESLNQVNLGFSPMVQSADAPTPNGQVIIGSFAGQNIDDWFVDISPLLSSQKTEFILTFTPVTAIPTPSAGAFTLLGMLMLILRRTKAHLD